MSRFLRAAACIAVAAQFEAKMLTPVSAVCGCGGDENTETADKGENKPDDDGKLSQKAKEEAEQKKLEAQEKVKAQKKKVKKAQEDKAAVDQKKKKADERYNINCFNETHDVRCSSCYRRLRGDETGCSCQMHATGRTCQMLKCETKDEVMKMMPMAMKGKKGGEEQLEEFKHMELDQIKAVVSGETTKEELQASMRSKAQGEFDSEAREESNGSFNLRGAANRASFKNSKQSVIGTDDAAVIEEFAGKSGGKGGMAELMNGDGAAQMMKLAQGNMGKNGDMAKVMCGDAGDEDSRQERHNLIEAVAGLDSKQYGDLKQMFGVKTD